MRHLDLLIAAPSDPGSHVNWGDLHFARSLQLALATKGVGSRLMFRDTHRHLPPPPPVSGLLVLRGKFAPPLDWLRSQPYICKAIWLISWPLDPSLEELSAYDQLFVASAQDTARVARLSCKPATTLLQATAFSSHGAAPPPRCGLLFVGNTRGVMRPVVQGFAQAGLPLELIGDGWQAFGLDTRAKGVANAQLPQLYRHSLAVLNDHSAAMAAYGYLNNRVFDVLACGVPVITDVAPGCPPALAAGLVRTGSGSGLDAQTALSQAQELRADQPLMQAIAGEVRRHHSFTSRADTILDVMAGC
jgi:hypothetical protein